MGRVVSFRARSRSGPRPPRRAAEPWHVSVLVEDAAMRTPHGCRHCQGRLLIRFLPDRRWQVTFRPSGGTLSRAIAGDETTRAEEAIAALLDSMFPGVDTLMTVC